MTVFTPGRNIAMKLPERYHASTPAFYRDTLGFALTEVPSGATVEFGAMTLWRDRVPHQSQTDLWLDVRATDPGAARPRLADAGIVDCTEAEPLPDGFEGFWIAAPSGTIHLVSADRVEEG